MPLKHVKYKQQGMTTEHQWRRPWVRKKSMHVSGTFCPTSRSFWSFDLGLLWHASRRLSQVLYSSCKEATCKYVVAKHLLHSDGWSSYYFASWPWASTTGLNRIVWWLDCYLWLWTTVKGTTVKSRPHAATKKCVSALEHTVPVLMQKLAV